MIRQKLQIGNIPALLWGNGTKGLFVAVHGNMSHKADRQIRILAQEADAAGRRVLSFDLPQHGSRKDEPYLCKVQNCVKDLAAVMGYARTLSSNISLFACSMGAYFSLLEYKEEQLEQCLFLSPVVDMGRIINNIMAHFNVTAERLEKEKEVLMPDGQTFYWDYFCYVKEHPVTQWNHATSILYGSADNICEFDPVSGFAKRFGCGLKVMENGEHYFHTDEQLQFFTQWLQEHIAK